jgi:hypothetical protein
MTESATTQNAVPSPSRDSSASGVAHKSYPSSSLPPAVPPSDQEAALIRLIAEWRRNADLIAEDHKSEWFSEAAAMQRACADQLGALLVSQKDEEGNARVDREC